ncbi:MAG: acetate--CoA ligase family protein [Cyclonatronaceae bacterium]
MLEPFFSPGRIAVIGASSDPNKMGNNVVRNLIGFGFHGEIYPVNRHALEIAGLRCYPSVEELPEKPDLAIVIIPAPGVPGVLRDCGEAGIGHVIIQSGGFSETGDKGRAREEELQKIAREYGIRVMGPNCIGVIDTHTPLNTTFVVGVPDRGDIGFVSQSGAVVVSVMDWSQSKGIGFSRIATMGNQMDVSAMETMQAVADNPNTRVLTTYIEGISDGRKFLDVAREISLKKPFLALKGGQSEKGADAVTSHTGALSGSMEAWEAAFRKSGVLQVNNMQEMFDQARALAWQPLPAGKRVAILTNAGGFGILAVDALLQHGLEMAPLTDQTKAWLRERIPPAGSVNNPVDVVAGTGPATYALVLDALLADETVDAVIVIQAPQDWFRQSSVAEVIGEGATLYKKPVITCLMGKRDAEDTLALLHKRRIPNVAFPERAASILAVMDKRRLWLDAMKKAGKLTTRPPEIPDNAEQLIADGDWTGLAAAYGIPLPEQATTSNPDEAVRAAKTFGYPVVMKLISDKITHKTDIGGIRVGLQDEKEVRRAWDAIADAARKAGADMQGILVQEMLRDGQEVIIGIRQDDQFGGLVVFGTGGTEVELYRDVFTAVAPLNTIEAGRLIDATVAGRKLAGWRNMPPRDRNAVTDILVRMSHIAVNHPEITEMEINPLYVLEDGHGAFAIDIRGSRR